MLKKQAKSLAELIGSSDSNFANLASEARLRADLSDYLRKNIDNSLKNGFVHCNIQGGHTLVVTAASPEWASRLRFEARQIIDLCSQQNIEIKAVKVRVQA